MKKTLLTALILGSVFHAYLSHAEDSPNATESAAPAAVTDADQKAATMNEPAPAIVPAATTETAPPPPAVIPPVPVNAPDDTQAAPAPAAANVSSTATAAVTTTAQTAPVTTGQTTTPAENLEFVSGEITSSDEAAKTVTVKLYGETENATNDKILTIKLDESTDITDGEKDRDIKSLTNGTEVDVEYDPATNKATYIFVY